MRSQGNLKPEVLQSYNIQSSYQNKGSQVNSQKNSKNGQNRSTNLGYPSMMSPTTNSYGYNQIAKNNETQQYTQQYANPTSLSTQMTPTGKSLSFSNAAPMQYSKLANSIDSSSVTPSHQNNGLQVGGNNNNQYGFNKQTYGYGNYNTIDHAQGGAVNESNYLYNGYRAQNKRLSNTANNTNQSASTIIGYNVINSSSQNGIQGQLQSQAAGSQQGGKQNGYNIQDIVQLQLPKLTPHDGILMTKQMNGSVSEKASLRSPVIEFESTLNSGSRKQDPPSKNNLRNIVKYYNSNGQTNNSNPYSSPLQQSVSVPSVENQPQKQLVSIGSSIQSRQPSSNIPSSHNLKEQQTSSNTQNQNGNNTANNVNSSSNYYSISSARPPSNGTTKKEIPLNSQYMQYSSLGKNLNYLSSPSTQSSKIQNSQQSILSPNAKQSRLQSSENSQKTPLKSIQPAQVTGYSSIFNQNSINQSNTKQPSIQNANNDLLDVRMLPKIDKSKISTKQIGVVHAYGANTHQGLIRGYNEDRVSIILNMVKPQEKSHVADWPNISFFAIYDGHGGAQCADFLRDQLHFYIIKDEEFPKNPQRAIHNGFVKAEDAFLKITESQIPLDKSGSCAIVVMLINEQIYVANLGDSRAVLSQNNGQKVIGLTVDHKPNHPDEEKRIIMNGGKIYQSQIPTMQPKQYPQFVKGPHRVLPGRLAVSRTLGDIEAKLKKYGGNSKVILCEPEITQFQLSQEHDFIMLGCDGIFDKLTNNQSIDFIWDSMREQFRKKEMRQSLHDYIGEGIEYLIKQTLIHKSFDNLTVVIICFKNLEKLFLS
ncbi:serine/threonine phosphatase 2C (macronuclear) [Tetrahymena thermophila SB210]|uniref:protein-serine/threonine phosphatase n=1 Tax=Tetrahymena thermophila (strain SB210) TaxID=312017 RepID=I7MLK4_TETTS|nr:serine/threonine phosphatase 2C [Tetrahymena thermophila SB210]EAS02461.2 serine/threonine phosphatase 2C [Tetrahymena thermophila SB210]|eukprot:XP_001022706.2 serine/threonine phosphatase 2C [Tetrahymena thermophila SB210]